MTPNLISPRRFWPFKKTETLLLAMTVSALTVLWIGMKGVDPEIFREHGPMENFQAGCLVFGALAWALIIPLLPRTAGRLALGGLVLLHINFFALEFDVKGWNAPVLEFFFQGVSRNVIFGTAWAVFVVLAARRMGALRNFGIPWLQTRSGCFMLLAGGFWVLGGIVDKAKPFISSAVNFMAEELMESNAALLMVLSVIWFAKELHRHRAALIGTSNNPHSAR